MAIYKYRQGVSFPVPASVVGEVCEEIRAQNGDVLTPKLFVDAARPRTSQLHGLLTWDNKDAAEKCRLAEARQIISSIRVSYETPAGPRMVQGYVSVKIADAGRSYVTSARAVSEPELREQMITDALTTLDAWRRRYAHLTELCDLFDAVENARTNMESRAS